MKTPSERRALSGLHSQSSFAKNRKVSFENTYETTVWYMSENTSPYSPKFLLLSTFSLGDLSQGHFLVGGNFPGEFYVADVYRENFFPRGFFLDTEIITRNWPYELPGESPNYLIKTLNLSKWGSFKAVYLSFHWFDDIWTRGFGLITREFVLLTRRFELVTCRFELLTRGFEIITLESCTRNSWIWTRGFELAVLNFNLCF